MKFTEIFGIVISIISLVLSLWTLWVTRGKKGVVKVTRPNVIFLGPDGGSPNQKKLFFRTLMFSTSERGNYIESMYAKIFQNGTSQIFNIWVYGDKDLLRGSGLYVDKKGIANNHNFLLPANELSYEYKSGNYKIEIYVQLIKRKPKKVFEEQLFISEEQSSQMKENKFGLYFDWDVNSQKYFSHIYLMKAEEPDLIHNLLKMKLSK